jgi:Zn-finger nucleic acid-binding protein
MKCPKCGHDLRPEKIETVEIDRCSFCEGFFLDAGEMEQLFLQRTQTERRSIFKRMIGL